MSKAKFKAVWKDGSIKLRSSESRIYSHAWRVNYEALWNTGPKPGTTFGFAGSLTLAQAAVVSQMKPGEKYRPLSSEIVAVERIT